MANSQFFQFRYSKERDVVELFLKVSIGASGAPTIVQGKGITSITRNSAGNYSILLPDTYNMMLDMNAIFLSGASAPAAPGVNIVSETVASTKIVRIQCRDVAAAAADPASGEVLMLRIAVRNAST